MSALEDIDVKNHKIMSMDAAKRERVLNAAMSEFRKGFHDASTDAMVREAGISKGLLFHYFGTKEALYRFMIRYAAERIQEEFVGLINTKQSDLLDRLWQMLLLKMDLSYRYPAIFEFMATVYAQERERPAGVFFTEFKKLRDKALDDVYSHIDTTRFKDGIDPQKAANIIRWTMLGYAETVAGQGKTLEEYQNEYGRYIEDLEGYFTILRQILYK